MFADKIQHEVEILAGRIHLVLGERSVDLDSALPAVGLDAPDVRKVRFQRSVGCNAFWFNR